MDSNSKLRGIDSKAKIYEDKYFKYKELVMRNSLKQGCSSITTSIGDQIKDVIQNESNEEKKEELAALIIQG